MTARLLREVGLLGIRCGLSMIPPSEDGEKRPISIFLDENGDSTWLHPPGQAPDARFIEKWFGPRQGIGVRTGSESGGLEGFEFDCPTTYKAFKELARKIGLCELVARIEAGYREETPGGGVHLLYYCCEIRGSTKLAQRPTPTPKNKRRCKALIETKGENGFLILAPSGGKVHPTGRPYVLTQGGLDSVVTISSEERDTLWDLGRSFDEMPAKEVRLESPGRPPSVGDRPGDAFSKEVSWADVLEPAKWTAVYTRGDATYWRRPDKTIGVSATTNHRGSGLLWVFTSSTAFESEHSYTKFGAYAVLNHGGDFRSAARCLKDLGYGKTDRVAVASSSKPLRPTGTDPTGPSPLKLHKGHDDGGAGEAGPPFDPVPDGPNESADDPHRLARIFMERNCNHPDGSTLVFHNGEFQRWDGAYRPMPDREVRAELNRTAKDEFDRLNLEEVADHKRRGSDKPKPKAKKVSAALVNNVHQALSGYALLSSRVQAPSWLCDDFPWPAKEVLPVRNGLVHLPSFADGKGSMVAPTPSFFSPYATDYDFDPNAPSPEEWYAFLRKLWPDDPQSYATLQEWFGYHLTTDVRQQKIGMIIGPPRSGKGTIIRILTCLMGAVNVCNPSLTSLGMQFGLAELIGKMAAIITDARITGRADIAQVVENLLSISGEDSKTIARKYLPDWSGKLALKFTIISNETPRLSDSSGAIASRMLILRLKQSFLGSEDKELFGRLLPELPGILVWAIAGWKRLNERGHFMQPESARPLIEEMEELSSPIGSFIKDCCKVIKGGEADTETLFGAWKEWCKKMNRENVGDSASFGRNLRSVVPELETGQKREFGQRIRYYKGIELTPDF